MEVIASLFYIYVCFTLSLFWTCRTNEALHAAGTLSCYCQSFLHALNFLRSEGDCSVTIRHWLTTYQKAANRHRDVSWQRLKAKGEYYNYMAWIFIYFHVGNFIHWEVASMEGNFDVLKLQRELYESAGSTFAKAWESQNSRFF